MNINLTYVKMPNRNGSRRTNDNSCPGNFKQKAARYLSGSGAAVYISLLIFIGAPHVIGCKRRRKFTYLTVFVYACNVISKCF